MSSYAKKSWNEDFDLALYYQVTENEDHTLSFSFQEQTQTFENAFNPQNEIYISIQGYQPVENPNVIIPGNYTIAFDKIAKGKHFILVNLILPQGKIAIGVKELLID
nr:hypothetical protein [Bacteroidota bacterium]